MKFNDLLEEIKLGTKDFETSKSSDDIINLYDKDYGIFFISERIKSLAEGVSEDSSAISLFNKVSDTFKEIEGKEIKNSKQSPIYYKVKLLSIAEDYNKIVGKFEDKKYHTKINKTNFAKALGTIQYGLSKISERADKSISVKDYPIVLSETASSEAYLIESIIE